MIGQESTGEAHVIGPRSVWRRLLPADWLAVCGAGSGAEQTHEVQEATADLEEEEEAGSQPQPIREQLCCITSCLHLSSVPISQYNIFAPPPPHLSGGLVAQLGGDELEGALIGSSLLTGGQDGPVGLAETGSGQTNSRNIVLFSDRFIFSSEMKRLCSKRAFLTSNPI